jgi:hypothetical protein
LRPPPERALRDVQCTSLRLSSITLARTSRTAPVYPPKRPPGPTLHTSAFPTHTSLVALSFMWKKQCQQEQSSVSRASLPPPLISYSPLLQLPRRRLACPGLRAAALVAAGRLSFQLHLSSLPHRGPHRPPLAVTTLHMHTQTFIAHRDCAHAPQQQQPQASCQ